jgi:hypothetical protein
MQFGAFVDRRSGPASALVRSKARLTNRKESPSPSASEIQFSRPHGLIARQH